MSNHSTTNQRKGGTSRQLSRLQLIHAEIDFHLRRGVTDKTNDSQGMKDVRVLLLAIRHHLGVGLMVWRQDPYTETRKTKGETEAPIQTLLYRRAVWEELPITITLEFTQISNYRIYSLFEILTIKQS